MSRLDDLIQQLCPSGIEYKKVKNVYKRLRGTPITAAEMKKIATPDGEIKIFAGGKTVINAKAQDIFGNNIIRVPAVLVQSRGIIDVVYYEKPFTFKNEMWAYTATERISVRFLFYVLKNNILALRKAASGMGSLPQISLSVTEKLLIPVPPLPVQEEIVRILDKFTALEAELEAELEARRKQYEFYRDQLLTFGDEVEWKPLGEIIISLKTGLNPRKNFNLNTPDASNYYVTVRELNGTSVVFYDKTDRINDDALRLINNRSKLEKGDLLFSGTGTIGRTAFISETPVNWNIKEGVYVIKPQQGKINPKYLLYILNTTRIRQQIDNKVVGSPVSSIPMAELKKIRIPVPPLAEQERIVAILDKFDTLVNDISSGLPAELEMRRKQYEHYRDRLLTFKPLAKEA